MNKKCLKYIGSNKMRRKENTKKESMNLCCRETCYRIGGNEKENRITKKVLERQKNEEA